MERNADLTSEYFNGQTDAMAGSSSGQSAITVNVTAAFGTL